MHLLFPEFLNPVHSLSAEPQAQSCAQCCLVSSKQQSSGHQYSVAAGGGREGGESLHLSVTWGTPFSTFSRSVTKDYKKGAQQTSAIFCPQLTPSFL